jgi:acetyl-CoA C-acetyltransferase
VLVTAGEILSAAPAEKPGAPTGSPLEYEPVPIDLMYYYTAFGIDQIYTAYNAPGGFAEYQSFQMIQYAKKYGLTIDQMDEIECDIRKVCRKHGSMNPKALFQMTLEQEAKKAGFNNVLDYWKSANNPTNAWPARVKGFLMPADGATAYIVCDPKIATRLCKKTPVDVIGHAWDGSNTPWSDKNFLEFPFDIRAVKKAYNMAGVTGKDLDYLYCHDCSATLGHLATPELMGYFPKGQAWKAVKEGRTLYTGDKPMCTSGGRNALGHAYAASAGAELYEIVKQMRGEAGKRQIKDRPKIAAQQNHGAMLHTAVSVYRRRS